MALILAKLLFAGYRLYVRYHNFRRFHEEHIGEVWRLRLKALKQLSKFGPDRGVTDAFRERERSRKSTSTEGNPRRGRTNSIDSLVITSESTGRKVKVVKRNKRGAQPTAMKAVIPPAMKAVIKKPAAKK